MDSRLSWPNSMMLKVRLVCYMSESLGTCETSNCNHYSLMMKSKPWSSFVPHFPFHGIIIICKKSWERKIQGDEIKHWLIHVDLFSWAAFFVFKRLLKAGNFPSWDWGLRRFCFPLNSFKGFMADECLPGRVQTDSKLPVCVWSWLVPESKENLYLSSVLL